MNLINKQEITILVHPFEMFYNKYDSYPEKYIKDICDSAAKKGVAIEVFNRKHMMPLNDFRNLIKYCLKSNTLMSIGSDAHEVYEIGNFDYEFIYSEIESQLKKGQECI